MYVEGRWVGGWRRRLFMLAICIVRFLKFLLFLFFFLPAR